MSAWEILVYGVLGATALTVLIFWIRYVNVVTCEYCYRPTNWCECNHCPHDRQTPVRWSQDGWVSYCEDCTEALYHGDNYARLPN